MKRIALMLCFTPLNAPADETHDFAKAVAHHQASSRRLSDQQDELAADVQQLTIEQTSEEVIELFREVEDAMDEASERLWEHETDGPTLAAQTEVIEKIYQAAKKRQAQSGKGGESPESGAMMQMLQRMLGMETSGKPKGPGEKPGESSGSGATGNSDLANGSTDGSMGGATGERRVPKGAGLAGKTLPSEFNAALKAYNLGLQSLEP